MANDDGPPDTPRPNGSPRRGRPQRSRNGRDSGTAPGVPDEDALPESAVATAEPEGAEPVPEPAAEPAAGPATEARPEGVGPVPEPAPAPPVAQRDRMDLPPLKAMSITKLAPVAKGLAVPRPA